jgi:hypothetical protein
MPTSCTSKAKQGFERRRNPTGSPRRRLPPAVERTMSGLVHTDTPAQAAQAASMPRKQTSPHRTTRKQSPDPVEPPTDPPQSPPDRILSQQVQVSPATGRPVTPGRPRRHRRHRPPLSSDPFRAVRLTGDDLMSPVDATAVCTTATHQQVSAATGRPSPMGRLRRKHRRHRPPQVQAPAVYIQTERLVTPMAAVAICSSSASAPGGRRQLGSSCGGGGCRRGGPCGCGGIWW